MSFAKSQIGLDEDQYVTITSFSHHPYHEQFVLEVPDNFSEGNYYNVELSDLTEILNFGLQNGYTVIWDCDVSENGFSSRQGIAIVPDLQNDTSSDLTKLFNKPHVEQTISPKMRQDEFDTYSLTDDHLMHIVGLAHDQEGNPYYYVKNSWGSEPGLNGYLFASKAYFELNTIAITLHKNGVPIKIWEKFSQ